MDKETKRQGIQALVEQYYKEFDFLHQEPLDFLLDKTLSLFLESDLTLEEIDKKILEVIHKKEKEIDKNYQPENVRRNHDMIYSKLEEIIPLLQKEGIDFHLAGALSCYLRYDEESDRCHDDIDFLVNEKDLERFGNVCEQLGYSFYDHRLETSRVLKDGIPSGEHEVLAVSPDQDFHIGVFCFECLVDGTFIIKGYYHDEENNPCCREEIISSDLAKEVIDTSPISFSGQSFTTTSPEYIYLLKSYTNSLKDQKDLSFLEGKIDIEKLARIQKLVKSDQYIQYTPINSIPAARKLNPNLLENDNSELSKMLVESNPKEEDKDSDKVLEKKDMTLVKDSGFVHKYAIVITILIIAVLVLIVFLVLKCYK